MTSGLQTKKRHLLGGYRVALRTPREADQQNLETREKSGCKADPSSFICLGKHAVCSLQLLYVCFILLYSYSCCCMSAMFLQDKIMFLIWLLQAPTVPACSCVTNRRMIDSESQFHVRRRENLAASSCPLNHSSDLTVAGVENSGQAFTHFRLTVTDLAWHSFDASDATKSSLCVYTLAW